MNNKLPLDSLIEQDKKEWLEAIEDIYQNYGAEGVSAILGSLSAWQRNHLLPGERAAKVNTPYLNSIGVNEQPAYPGNTAIEQRIEHILRWSRWW